MNKDEILSLIQLKTELSKQTVPRKANHSTLPIKADLVPVRMEHRMIEEPQMIQFDIFQENIKPAVNIVNPAKPTLQSIIIEPRQSPHIKENTRFDIGIESNRSSVIVRCQKPEPDIKYVPIFQDQVKAFDDNEGETSKSATGIIWTKDDALTIATDSIFN